MFCIRVNWKALASLTKKIQERENCSKKLGSAPKARDRNFQVQILGSTKDRFQV